MALPLRSAWVNSRLIMFVRRSDDSPNIFVCGGSKLPEWVLTQDELDELRDSIDLVRPRPGPVVVMTTSNLDIAPAVMWRKKDR